MRVALVLVLLVSAAGCGRPSEPTGAPISEFSLGIVPLNGFGYTVTFRSGGSATDVRSGDLVPDIECVGTVSQLEYESVASVVAAEGFFSLATRYGAHPDYPPTVFTSATREGTQRTVRNYPGAAPASLARIQRAMRNMRERVTWAAKSGRPAGPDLCSYPFFFGLPE